MILALLGKFVIIFDRQLEVGSARLLAITFIRPLATFLEATAMVMEEELEVEAGGEVRLEPVHILLIVWLELTRIVVHVLVRKCQLN